MSGQQVEARRVTFADVVDAANEVLKVVTEIDLAYCGLGGTEAAFALNRRREALVTVRQNLHSAAHARQRRWAVAELEVEAERLRQDFNLGATS